MKDHIRRVLPDRTRSEVRIGCSGWTYASWRDEFYPSTLPSSRWLLHYASVFDTVETNGTFYRLPEADTFIRWHDATPTNFLMSVKASRYLTHLKQLREPEEPLERLISRAAGLGSKLGPLLYQFPPTLQRSDERLLMFLRALTRRTPSVTHRLRHVIEFRHPSWYTDAVFAMLERHDVACCLHDRTGSSFDTLIPGSFAYIRFHGTSGRYAGEYTLPMLRRWAHRIALWHAQGRDVYAYFNNDPGAAAPRNALMLRSLLGLAETTHASEPWSDAVH